jgi:hypothetical protein
MTNSAIAYNVYEKSEVLSRLELLHNKINNQMRRCKLSINKASKQLKKCSSVKYRKTCLIRASKLQNYQDNCKNINMELNAIIAWVDAEYIRMNANFISLRLYNATYNLLKKINKYFPRLNPITLDILKHVDKQIWSDYYQNTPQQDERYDPVDLSQTQKFHQANYVLVHE